MSSLDQYYEDEERMEKEEKEYGYLFVLFILLVLPPLMLIWFIDSLLTRGNNEK